MSMGALEGATQAQEATAPGGLIVNDFSIVVATANGTGSQTSNMAILRALFKMGIPVNGKKPTSAPNATTRRSASGIIFCGR